MSNLVETVARIIENELDYRYFPQNYNGWSSLTDLQRRMFLGTARAAIRAVEADMRNRAATHRHRKRGSEYELLGVGNMQSDHWLRRNPRGELLISVDYEEVAIYRSLDSGRLWARPRDEFEDGRFEALPLSDGESE